MGISSSYLYKKENKHLERSDLMKKSEPKMILNLSLEDEEFEKKIAIAMEKYTEDVILKNLDETIVRIVNNRIDRLVSPAHKWDDNGKIAGKTLDAYIRERTESVISDVIDKNIKDIFAKKVAEMI